MVPFALIDTGHGVGWIAHAPRKVRISQAISEWGVSILYRRTTVSQGLLAGAALLGIAVVLLVVGGDRRTRLGAAVAGGIAAFVWVAPLVLGVLGHDYFLSRNVIPAVVPLAVVLGAVCAAPRARALGAALAVALIALFVYATIRVQTKPYLERPDWRAVAHALGPATVPRAVLAANGTTATPLKIYLAGVKWVQPQSQRILVRGDRCGGSQEAASAQAGASRSRWALGLVHAARRLAAPGLRLTDGAGWLIGSLYRAGSSGGSCWTGRSG